MCVQPQDAAATFRLKYKCINNLEYSLNRLVVYLYGGACRFCNFENG